MTPHLAEALALISPRSDQKDACAAMLSQRVELLRGAYRDLESLPSAGELRAELADIGRDLARIKAALWNHSPFATALIFRKDVEKQAGFLAELEELIDSAKFHHALVVRPGSQPWDNVKALTARLAVELLRDFSTKKPTKTAAKDGGAFLALTALLYEAVTGERKADLGRYCRDVLDNAGDSRIEPNVVVRVPFKY